MAIPAEQSPATGGVIRLDPWQKRWFADRSRVKVIVAHRQSGKDFEAACEAVGEALEQHAPWYIVSVTQRQADETFAKCRQVAEAMKRVARRRAEVHLSEREFTEYDAELDQSFHRQAHTLHLPGGGSVTALPGRDPDTLAGLTGNVIFTEFGLFPKGGYDHWRVIFPLITRGYRIIVISTPRGRNTKFHELVSAPEQYSVHTQTLPESVAEGFVLRDNDGRPTDIETFRRLYNDEAGWRREYLCEFTGDMESLVRWMALASAGELGTGGAFECLTLEGGAGWRPDFFSVLKDFRGRPEIGWDVARHKHFSAVWVNRAAPDGVRHLERLVLMQECEFSLQRSIIRSAMDLRADAVGCGDATGLGMDSNETLVGLYGDRWQPVTFTTGAKRELGSLLATAYGDRAQALPPIDGPSKFIHTDIYALQKEGDMRDLRLVETANPLLEDSHCDLAYANSLALKASTIEAGAFKAWTS